MRSAEKKYSAFSSQHSVGNKNEVARRLVSAGLCVCDGGVEEFDQVVGGHVFAETAEFLRDLKKAPGVGGDECGATSVCDGAGFAFAELVGCLRLDEVVDSGGAAAACVREFENVDTGNAVEKVAGLLADALGVEQVTGVLIGDAHGERITFCARREFSKDF